MTAAVSTGESTADFVVPRFRTGDGACIRNLRLHYRVYGDLAAGRRNGCILVFHALTGSAAVHEWWAPLLGPGRALDTSRHAVIAANLPGSCYGSSGPMSDPSFPALSTADMARAHVPLLAHLGVDRLALAIGGSLGGMVALQWGRLASVPTERLVVLAAPAATSAQAIAWNAAQRLAIEADPRWQHGRYAPGAGPAAGLAAARAIAMITYRSPAEFSARFGRASTRVSGRFDVEHYLRRQGEKLVERFDARAYVALMRAMDLHDLGDLDSAARDTAARVQQVVGVGIDTDILYAPGEVQSWVDAYHRRGVHAVYRRIRSVYGHDAFLVEYDQLTELLRPT